MCPEDKLFEMNDSELENYYFQINDDSKARAHMLRFAAEYIESMKKKNFYNQQKVDDLKRQNDLLESQIQTLERIKATGKIMVQSNEITLPKAKQIESQNSESNSDKTVVDETARDKTAEIKTEDEIVVDDVAIDETVVVDLTAEDETAVDETAVDETAVDESAVDKTAVDETAVDKTAVDETAVDKTVVGETGKEN